MKTTKKKAGFIYQIPEDSSDEVVTEMKSRMRTLSRNQLEMLIFILSQEILKLKHQLESHSSSILNPDKLIINGSCQIEDNELTHSAAVNCSTCQIIFKSIPKLSQFQALKLEENRQQKELVKNLQFLIFGASDKDINSNNVVAGDGVHKKSTEINIDVPLSDHQISQVSSSFDDFTFLDLSDQSNGRVKETTGMEFHEDLLPLSARKSNKEAAESDPRMTTLGKKWSLQHDANSKKIQKSLLGQMKDVAAEHSHPTYSMNNSNRKSLESIDSKNCNQEEIQQPDNSDVFLPRCLNRPAKSGKFQNVDKNKKFKISKQSVSVSRSNFYLKTAEGKVDSLSCCLCKGDFQSKLKLNHHMKTQHKRAQYSCVICGKSFTHKHNLKIHQKNRHNRTTVLCSYCGKLLLQTRLKTHIEKVHEKPLFTCHICQKGFLKRECFEGHINKHSNTKPYICECCGRKYAYSTSLSSHKKLCNQASLPPHLQQPRNLDNKNSSFICETCGVKFEGVSGLKDHINAKHSNKSQSCSFCGKGFQWRPSYNRHVKKCKDRTDLERERCRRLLCQKSVGRHFVCICGKQYLYRQSYRRHEKSCKHK